MTMIAFWINDFSTMWLTLQWFAWTTTLQYWLWSLSRPLNCRNLWNVFLNSFSALLQVISSARIRLLELIFLHHSYCHILCSTLKPFQRAKKMFELKRIFLFWSLRFEAKFLKKNIFTHFKVWFLEIMLWSTRQKVHPNQIDDRNEYENIRSKFICNKSACNVCYQYSCISGDRCNWH